MGPNLGLTVIRGLGVAKFALKISEDTLPIITVLNNEIFSKELFDIKDGKSYFFLFDIIGGVVENRQIFSPLQVIEMVKDEDLDLTKTSVIFHLK